MKNRIKVTLDNIEKLPNGIIKCPISTNKFTEDSYFLINEDILPQILGRCWYVNDRAGGCYYIRSSVPNRIDAHQLVFNNDFQKTGLMIDHIDRTKWWDNTRTNLRLVSPLKNILNSSPHKDSKSVYLGIRQLPHRNNKWQACIKLPELNKEIRLYGPLREDAEEAAMDRDLLVLTYYPKEAKLNFPEDWE